jgi:sugar phosphate isomerase/epimerase
MRSMTLTRRSILRLMTGALAASARPVHHAFAGQPRSGTTGVPHPPGGRLGLQLYSLRNELKADVPGTLKIVRNWGFEEVELADFPAINAEERARALKTAGLRAVSAFYDYERYRDDLPAVIRDARTLGLEYLICGWIPHQKTLTRADVDRAIADFSKWGAGAVREGLRFAYHIHGFEFEPSQDGTLLDTMLKTTDPQHVDYEMDVFWVTRGGGDPVALLGKYGSRFRLVHLKDMRRGTETGVRTGQAPIESNVVLGTGMIPWPAVLKAAATARVKWYFIEDEHPEAIKQIPQSIEYLRGLKL